MKLPRRNFLHLAAGAAALPAASRIAWAQTYPARPVRIVAPFAAGGQSDVLARLMGQWLSEHLAQQFIVEDRPGAGSNIGTEAVVNAPPDGYTLLLVNPANTINATLYEKLNFNFIRDIAPVASIDREPLIMMVNPSVPKRSCARRQTATRCSWSVPLARSTRRCTTSSISISSATLRRSRASSEVPTSPW